MQASLEKKSEWQNPDYFVADSMEHLFGKTKIELVIGLNLSNLVIAKRS